MTKRIITIIAVLLAILFLLLGGIWLVGRHQAQKNGTTPLTFRQFLGLGTSAKPASNVGGTLTSTFTGQNGSAGSNGGTGSAAQNGIGTNNAIGGATDNTQSSQFTNGSISPDTSALNSGNSGPSATFGTAGALGNSGIGISGSTLPGTGTGSSGSISSGSGTLGGLNCTTADTTITFTQAEIQQLNALQAQYNAVATDLATETDVANELSNYNNSKLTEAKIAELQNFCQANVPLLTDPELKRHVPTPFWHDASQDSETYTISNLTPATMPGVTVKIPFGSITAGGAVATSLADATSFLERVLRINLW